MRNEPIRKWRKPADTVPGDSLPCMSNLARLQSSTSQARNQFSPVHITLHISLIIHKKSVTSYLEWYNIKKETSQCFIVVYWKRNWKKNTFTNLVSLIQYSRARFFLLYNRVNVFLLYLCFGLWKLSLAEIRLFSSFHRALDLQFCSCNAGSLLNVAQIRSRMVLLRGLWNGIFSYSFAKWKKERRHMRSFNILFAEALLQWKKKHFCSVAAHFSDLIWMNSLIGRCAKARALKQNRKVMKSETFSGQRGAFLRKSLDRARFTIKVSAATVEPFRPLFPC